MLGSVMDLDVHDDLPCERVQALSDVIWLGKSHVTNVRLGG